MQFTQNKILSCIIFHMKNHDEIFILFIFLVQNYSESSDFDLFIYFYQTFPVKSLMNIGTPL